MRLRKGFTLVELLVVIGIIALLVAILLPALSSARKQAERIKCEAALKEVGNAFIMYAMENNQSAPPTRASGATYNVNGYSFTTAIGPPYWISFLAKYVTKTKLGFSGTDAAHAADAMTKSVFWGCPAWSGYYNSAAVSYAGYALNQNGYGMNGFPEYTPTFPGTADTLGEGSYLNNTATVVYGSSWQKLNATNGGTWYKFNRWTHPTERAIAGDGIYWILQSRPALAPPSNIAAQVNLGNWAATYSANGVDGPNENTVDCYRHGKYPKQKDATTFSEFGGKVSYNILFADGHVSNLVDRESSYKVIRMRYPG